jgi:hypothetical protein
MGLLMVMAGIVTSNAQSPSDIDAIKAANQSFYTALSALDAKAMKLYGLTSLMSLILDHSVRPSLLATKMQYPIIG